MSGTENFKGGVSSMKKKTLAMLIGAAMVTAAITGCTSGSKETEAPATETVTEAAAEQTE